MMRPPAAVKNVVDPIAAVDVDAIAAMTVRALAELVEVKSASPVTPLPNVVRAFPALVSSSTVCMNAETPDRLELTLEKLIAVEPMEMEVEVEELLTTQ